jgi:hypothetical protein
MHKVTHDLPNDLDSASGSIAGAGHGLVAKRPTFTTLPDPMTGLGVAVGVSADSR